MIHKSSLLKEFKRDKRPIHTCMTQWEDICRPTQTELKMIQMVAKHAEETLTLYAKRLDEQLLDQHTNKIIRVVRCKKLQLPVEHLANGTWAIPSPDVPTTEESTSDPKA